MKNDWLITSDGASQLQVDISLAQGGDYTPKPTPETYESEKGVNVLQIRGPMFARSNMFTKMLGLKSTEDYMEEFSERVLDGKPILMDIDTPGGQASLVFEFADMIHNSPVPVFGFSQGSATSAGYLLLSATHEAYVTESASVGSIGVVIPLPEEQGGVIVASKNAKNKIPTPEVAQKQADSLEELFHEKVSTYTGMSKEDVVLKGEEGRALLGRIAAERGFVNGVSNYSNTLVKAAATLPESSTENSLMKKTETNSVADTQQQMSDAVSANNDRWVKLLGEPNALSNVDALIAVATNPKLDDGEAVEMLGFVAAKAPEQSEPEAPEAPAAPAAPNAQADTQPNILDILQQAAQLAQAPADNHDENGSEPEVKDKLTSKQEDANWISEMNDSIANLTQGV